MAGDPERRGRGTDWNMGWDKWMSPTSFFGDYRAPQPGAALDATPILDRLVSLLKSRFIGRRQTVRTKGGDVTLTITDLEAPLDPAAVKRGQLDDVTVLADDICWRDLRFASGRATLHNVYLRAGVSELVSAPVDVCVTLAADDLAALVAKVRPELLVEVTQDAVALVSWRRHPDWGQLEVDADVDGTLVRVRSRALVRGQRRLQAVRRLPPVAFRLPLPADRVVVRSLRPVPGSVEMVARVDQLRIPVAPGGPEELVRRLGRLGSLLDVSKWSP